MVKANFGTALDNASGPVTIRISTLAGSTGSGNRPSSAIDDFQLSWNTPTATTPVLTVTPTSLAFGSQNISTTSAAQTYSLAGTSLSAPATVTVTGPFSISKDNATYGTSLSYSPAELASAQPVYVKFAPTATGPATGTITNASTGATSRPVALTGTGANPNQTVFSFDNCTSALSDGWSQYSVTGPQVWACTTFGRDPNNPTGTAASPNGVQMNGYSGGNIANEDWFISPAFNLTSYTYPLFSFWSRTAFTGPVLKLRVSTNYSGTGDPNAATWTDLNAQFPAVTSDTWTQTPNVNLAAFKGTSVYVAFVYTSTSAAAARWTVDDIALTNSATPPAPTLLTDVKSLAFGYVPAQTSADRTLNVSASDLTGNVTLTSSDPLFTLSKDGSTFGSSLALTPADVNGSTKAVTVRFRPTTTSATFTGTVGVSTPGAAASLSVALSGDTYDTSKTLEVVNYNIEWFGSTGAGLGPTDKDLQQANITTMLKGLAADVFVLEEVVDTVRLHNAVASLSATLGVPYGIKVSDFGTSADDPTSANWAGDQKVTFVYRKDVVKPVLFQGLLRCTMAQACTAYSDWASGRFPFLMAADVTLDGQTKRVNFVGIHAKANSTATSPNDYARRQDGANLLKALLDSSYPGANNLILGDYNDVLNGTIATDVTPAVSSYSSFLNDANYVPLTLALANAGAQSTVSYATVIDNVIASAPLANYYINGTAAIRTDVAATIPNYGTTTSDHYPVFTRYSFSAPDLVVSTPNQTVPGGTYNSLTITGSGAGTLQGPVTVIGTVTVQSGGRLDTNCQPLTGAASFTVAAGGTLGICDAAGLSATGSTGAIQVTGTRSFSTDATYVYNGTSTQLTGTGLPTQVRALTTTNASSLTLSQPLTVAQTLTLAGSGNLALNSQALTLSSSAQGTALVVNSGTGVVQGATATVQRYLDGSLNGGPGYHHLGTPVSGATVASLGTASFVPVVNPAYNTSATPGAVQPFPTVYGYDESRLVTATSNLLAFDKGYFSPASLTDALVVGKGYTANLSANQLVAFGGTLNTGDYALALTRQSQLADAGWQLLSNPYPAPLDYSLVAATDRAGLDAALYVYQSTGQYAGQYRSYVNGVGNSVLPLGQAFFVRVSQGQSSAQLALHNSQRATSYATQVSVQRTAETRPRLNLTLSAAGGTSDGLYFYAEPGTTAGYDAQQDAAKLPNPSGLNLATLSTDGQPLSIQALPTLAGRFALRVQVPAAGTYVFTAAELLNLPAGTQPVLEDVQTGQHTSLAAAGSTYSFTVAPGEPVDGRFWLNLGSATALATQAGIAQTTLALYPNPVTSTVRFEVPETGTGLHLQVLGVDGRLVLQATGSVEQLNQQLSQRVAGLGSGLYLIRVVGQQQTYVSRFQKL